MRQLRSDEVIKVLFVFTVRRYKNIFVDMSCSAQVLNLNDLFIFTWYLRKFPSGCQCDDAEAG